MNRQRVFARAKGRNGKGLLPPNRKLRQYEHHALDLREELGLGVCEPLCHLRAYETLKNVIVYAHSRIPAAKKYLDHFTGTAAGRWSGLAVKDPENWFVVIYNDVHPLQWVRATLMEELFHIRLGHPASRVHVKTTSGNHRSYDAEIENEAYGSGAAALVPYRGLQEMLRKRLSLTSVADHFQVSEELVRFRAFATGICAANLNFV